MNSLFCMRPAALRTCLVSVALGCFLCAALLSSHAAAMTDATREPLSFSLHKKETGKGPTLMVVGGIQGDEPGAFSAASLLVTHYDIHTGNVWVVPNLNVLSMVRSARGTRGDLNRKFARIAPNDPDMPIIERIKPLLLHEKVDLILNMHDGSGFYRPSFQTPMRNPKRWGQSIIIDQASLPGARYPHLEKLADTVAAEVNRHLLDSDHLYHVKNTKTAEGDLEMAKTLTWFAVTHGKAAFGQEVSKDFPLPVRVYYHLSVLESFMRRLGISFDRRFPLTPDGIAQALGNDVSMASEDGRLFLSLDNVRATLRFIPQNSASPLGFTASSPILTVVDEKKDGLHIYYGNRRLTRLSTFSTAFDDSLSGILLNVDGKKRHVPFGSIVPVNSRFSVEPLEGYRVNAIGATVPGAPNGASECGISFCKKDFAPAFSLDKGATLYRIEVYRRPEVSDAKKTTRGQPDGKNTLEQGKTREEAFAGMILVRFGPAPKAASLQPATPNTPHGR